MDKELKDLIIGAFLHDVGKISQRAKVKLSDQSERMKAQACPTNQFGSYGYSHVPYTNQFFEEIQGWLPKSQVYWANVANYATYHHKPQMDNLFDLIIQQADCLSAGHDRSNDKEADIKENKYYLESIFSKIAIGDNIPVDTRFHQIVKNTLNEDCYPCENNPDNPDSSLEVLYEKMKGQVQNLENSVQLDFDVFLEHLKWVYSQYAWCIPSSLRQASDVSLLDHSLTTAAIASVMYVYHKQTDTFNGHSIKDKSLSKFRLVSGDVSGIQDYIFADSTAKPSGVSKRLRAKSFYISVLTQVCSMMILRDLGLPCFCKVLDAGGRFTLLVPNTENTLSQLKNLQNLIDDWMFKTFAGRLKINLAFNTEFSGEDFLPDKKNKKHRFEDVYKKLLNDTERAKKKPFNSIFIGNDGWKCEKMISDISGESIKDKQEQELDYFEKLGRDLPNQTHLLVIRKKQSLDIKNPFEYPFDRYQISVCGYENVGSKDDTVVAKFRFVPGQDDFTDIADGQYIANYVPKITQGDLDIYQYLDMSDLLSKEGESWKDIGETKTFAHIAADSVKANEDGDKAGVPMLGVLKADVDRLGMIFSNGLKDSKSIARMATLSRQIDMFFKGVLPNHIKTKEKYKNIYTIYAGGDDLLLVGPWDTILSFASFMQEKFTQYTCSNPSITISAGIAVVKSGFPLSEAARLAEEALEKSKDGDKDKNNGRNKITIFGQTLSWQDYKHALEDGEFIDMHLEESINPDTKCLKLTKGFAYRLVKYARMGLRAEEDVKNNKPIKLADAKWISQLSYDIGRNIGNDLEDNRIIKLKEVTGQRNVSRLLVAATYCNYKNRSK